MEVYEAGNPQLLIIGQFFKKSYKILLAAVLIIFLTMAGVNFWQKRVFQKDVLASRAYQDVLVAEYTADFATAKTKGEELIKDYPRTPYAQLAALLLAKIYLADNQADLAAEKLRWILAQSSAKKLTYHIATVRLAAVLQDQGKYADALAVVAQDPEKEYLSIYAEARGDIYVAQGDIEQARRSYKQAINSLPSDAKPQMLQLKLMDVGGDENA